MPLSRSVSAWIRRVFACMGGCLACCSKSRPITAVDEPSKGLRIQGRTITAGSSAAATAKKRSQSEDLWSTTSTYEMDMDNNSARQSQSQRSLSSLSTHAAAASANASSSSTTNNNPNFNRSAEFVNHGLMLWNHTRQHWLANNKKTQPSNSRSHHPQEPKLSWSATYESLLGTNKPFPQPIPLSEMVDFLVDVWEQEGMYD